MQLRTVAAAAAAAAVAILATGCNILTPQATTIEYDASDGVSGQTGTVEVHNALLLGEPGGDDVSLAATLTNSGEPTFVEVRVGGESQEIRVPSGVTVYGVEQQLVFPVGDAEPGGLTNVSFQAEGAEPAGLRVPYMTTDFPGYESYGPSPSPEPVETAVPTATPSPTTAP